jgi:hypothetical protein
MKKKLIWAIVIISAILAVCGAVLAFVTENETTRKLKSFFNVISE